MKRISITFYDEVCEQLEQKARDKNISLAHYVRQLVELGLKVEAYSEQPKGAESSLDESLHQLKEELQKWAQKDLLADYESLYLLRYLVAELVGKNKEKDLDYMKKARQHAEGFVQGTLGLSTLESNAVS